MNNDRLITSHIITIHPIEKLLWRSGEYQGRVRRPICGRLWEVVRRLLCVMGVKLRAHATAAKSTRL
jgi:hypothetical protein